jgi:hypothetical protein
MRGPDRIAGDGSVRMAEDVVVLDGREAAQF